MAERSSPHGIGGADDRLLYLGQAYLMRDSREGSVAVVTGAAGGIGAAVVGALEAAGHRVVGVDARPSRTGPSPTSATSPSGASSSSRASSPSSAASAVGAAGVGALDVTDSAAVEGLMAEVEREAAIEVLVNCAGTLGNRPALATTQEEWARIFAVNATGVFTVSTAVARRMLPRRRGVIVTVASNAGRLPRHGMAAYGASKAAAALFTQSLGLELAEFGIRCNVVSPGTTRTPMVEGMLADAGIDEETIVRGDPGRFKAGIPLGRIAEPDDIASVVAFLASPAARHVTMQDLVVDGGAAMTR